MNFNKIYNMSECLKININNEYNFYIKMDKIYLIDFIINLFYQLRYNIKTYQIFNKESKIIFKLDLHNKIVYNVFLKINKKYNSNILKKWFKFDNNNIKELYIDKIKESV